MKKLVMVEERLENLVDLNQLEKQICALVAAKYEIDVSRASVRIAPERGWTTGYKLSDFYIQVRAERITDTSQEK